MVLDFAIEAILPISVPVISISGIVSVAALPWSLGLVSIPNLEPVVWSVLESGDFILDPFVIFYLRLAVVLDG